jgi:hypothetical protein
MKPKSKSSRYLIVPLIVCTLAACNTAPQVTVKTDYDHAALQSSLRSSLAGRGLKEAGNNSDLYIVPTVFTQEKLNVMPGGGYTFYPSSYGRYRMGTRTLNAEVQQYTEGTLVIDFVDRKTHKIVYRGLGQAAVGSTERNANAIQEAVNKIVAAYPG